MGVEQNARDAIQEAIVRAVELRIRPILMTIFDHYRALPADIRNRGGSGAFESVRHCGRERPVGGHFSDHDCGSSGLLQHGKRKRRNTKSGALA